MFLDAISIAVEKGCFKDGDLVVITAGAPVGVAEDKYARIHIVGSKI